MVNSARELQAAPARRGDDEPAHCVCSGETRTGPQNGVSCFISLRYSPEVRAWRGSLSILPLTAESAGAEDSGGGGGGGRQAYHPGICRVGVQQM